MLLHACLCVPKRHIQSFISTHIGALLSCRALLKKAAGRQPKEISLQYIPCPQGYIPRVMAALSENATVSERGEQWTSLHHSNIVEAHKACDIVEAHCYV